ncbi:MAG: hypothetical protein P4L85_22275, partial [Paludisphaera borealis]|uniref:hypothetical protein n=1 Tax=Paludisphaera borealis TaxID=1387353 RepID=UPI00284D31B6
MFRSTGSLARAMQRALVGIGCSGLCLGVAFAQEPYLLQGFTTDHERILERLRLLHAYGRTALYD